MIGVLAFVAVGGALAIDAAARDLVADVRLAMKRADLSLDYVARATGVPYQRLSDQLNGKTPFTAFWRFTCKDICDTGFWHEWLTLRAERLNRAIVLPRDVATLIAKVDALIDGRPMPMARMSEVPTHPITLPLRQKESA